MISRMVGSLTATSSPPALPLNRRSMPLRVAPRTARGPPSVGLAFAVVESLDHALLAPLDCQGPRRNVLRDGGPGARPAPVPHRDRGHQHRIRADEGLVAHHGGVLVVPVVVAGDGARADVREL